MKTNPSFIVLLLAMASPLRADVRTSASYTFTNDTADIGGGRAKSAAYTDDGSLGSPGGYASLAVPAETVRDGYAGQLFDVTALTLTAATPLVNEGGTDQLAAWQALDDGSFVVVPATAVAWSPAGGPLTGIGSSGLATAGIVYEDTAATAQGSLGGFTATLTLTVRNVNGHDFGSYAGDGIDDQWQVQNFGLNNSLASPSADPDGDGLNNLGEWAFGLDPIVGSGGKIVAGGGILSQRGLPDTSVQHPGHGVDFRAVFGRRRDYLAWRLIYTVQFSSDLITWESSTATPSVIADDGTIEAAAMRYPFFRSSGPKATFFRVVVTLAP